MGISIGIATLGPVATNCYIAGNAAEAVIIDPASGTPDDVDIIASLVEDRSVKAILITHGHFDHIAGLTAVRERYGAPVFIHENDARMITDAQLNMSAFFGVSVSSGKPEHIIHDGESIRAGELSFTVIHTPGHTPGSVCYSIEDILFSGDTLFAHGIGRTDFPGGDGEAIIASIQQKIFTLPAATHLYPGHDADCTIEERMRTGA